MMTTTKTRYIFDTCLMLYISRAEPISTEAISVLDANVPGRQDLYVSSFSAWEVGMLVSKGRLRLTRSPLDWFARFTDEQDLIVLDTTPQILVASSFLPQPIHSDPSDRIIIATAREHDLTIITRDHAILAYGAAGHVKTLAC